MNWKKVPKYNRKVKYNDDLSFNFCLKSRFGGVFRFTFYGQPEVNSFLYPEDVKVERVNFKGVISHYHISDDAPCWGGFEIPIKEVWYFGEIDELISLCQRFLDHHNEDDDYHEYCTRCGYFQGECEC